MPQTQIKGYDIETNSFENKVETAVTTGAASDDVVKKTGDTMTGNLTVPGLTIDGHTVSDFMKTVIDDNSAVEARATLKAASTKGYARVSITNYNNDDAPQVAAGSEIEVNGTLITYSSNTSISGSLTTNQINYIYVNSSGSTYWSSTVPVWNSEYYGWYNSGDRCIGGCFYDGNNYSGKFLLDINLTNYEIAGYSKFIAGTNIEANSFVGIADGKIYPAKLQQLRNTTSIESATIDSLDLDVFKAYDGYFAIAYADHNSGIKVIVGKYNSDGTVSTLATSLIAAADNPYYVKISCSPEDFKFVVAWEDENDYMYLRCRMGEYNNSTQSITWITTEASPTHHPNNNENKFDVMFVRSGKFAVIQVGDGGELFGQVGYEDNGSISFSSENTLLAPADTFYNRLSVIYIGPVEYSFLAAGHDRDHILIAHKSHKLYETLAEVNLSSPSIVNRQSKELDTSSEDGFDISVLKNVNSSNSESATISTLWWDNTGYNRIDVGATETLKYHTHSGVETVGSISVIDSDWSKGTFMMTDDIYSDVKSFAIKNNVIIFSLNGSSSVSLGAAYYDNDIFIKLAHIEDIDTTNNITKARISAVADGVILVVFYDSSNGNLSYQTWVFPEYIGVSVNSASASSDVWVKSSGFVSKQNISAGKSYWLDYETADLTTDYKGQTQLVAKGVSNNKVRIL